MVAAKYTYDTYIIDTLMRDLVGHDRRPSAYLVYITIAAGGDSVPAFYSLSHLAEQTGLSKRSVQGAIRHLTARGLLETHRAGPTDVPRYRALAAWGGGEALDETRASHRIG
ncbi:MAG: hypothetical protein QOE79_2801 [Sphingomonadales bacterium]|jgi:DNA-binding transcriptional ArsR family regulator|nr:hypothetical protein [Sphingomonadales bacterium]MEA3048405.1 hypothetical protein [Sphingomonadales bacterium]